MHLSRVAAAGPRDSARSQSALSGSAGGVTPFPEHAETGDMVVLVMDQGFRPGRLLVPAAEFVLLEYQILKCRLVKLAFSQCPLWVWSPTVTGTSLPHEAALPSSGPSDCWNTRQEAELKSAPL